MPIFELYHVNSRIPWPRKVWYHELCFGERLDEIITLGRDN